jgi:hypothetical protein
VKRHGAPRHLRKALKTGAPGVTRTPGTQFRNFLLGTPKYAETREIVETPWPGAACSGLERTAETARESRSLNVAAREIKILSAGRFTSNAPARPQDRRSPFPRPSVRSHAITRDHGPAAPAAEAISR